MKKLHKIRRLASQTIYVLTLPLVLIYYEILLAMVRGSSVTFQFAILYAAGAGAILHAVLAFLPKWPRRILRGLLLAVIGILFITECLVRSSFQQYMTLSAIISGAGGVMGHYSSNLLSAIISGLPIIGVYLLPTILYILDLRFCKKEVRESLVHHLVVLLLGGLVFACGTLGVLNSNVSALYRENYNFNTAVQSFGLLTGIRLDTEYAIWGNSSAEEFTFAEAPVAEAEEKTVVESSSEEIAETAESASVQEDVTEQAAESESVQEEEPVEEVIEYNQMELDFESLIASAPNDTIASLHSYVSSQTASEKNAYTGQFAGKNLIMICAEALSDHAVIPELTPTLARILNNGFVFTDYYQPSWGGSTSTGEYSFVLGLIPSDSDESMLETANDNLYFTMGNSMQRLGYTTYAFHSGWYTYYNRHLTHQNLGYTEFLASGQGMEEITGTSYAPDTLCFEKTLDLYLDKQPFSVYYMSISGHCNYTASSPLVSKYYDIVNTYVGNAYKETTKYYLCYQMELDRALEVLIQKLEEAGIADDTVIALTPDHYPYGLENSPTFGNYEDYMTDLYGYSYTNWWNLDTSVLAIWSTCMEKNPSEEGYVAPCQIDSVSYSIDVLPTLLNLYGIEFDSRLLPGRDLLAPNTEPMVVWENYSWLTDEIYHDADTGNNYLTDGSGNLAGSEYQEYIDAHNAIARNKILYSDKAVKNDYFRVLFGDDVNN